MPGNYTHSTRAPGLILTASIYNADHQNHVDNMTPDGVDDASADLAAFRETADPGEAGTESLPTSLRGELLRLRKLIAEISGKAQWYESPADSIESLNSRTSTLETQMADARPQQIGPEVVSGFTPELTGIPSWALKVTVLFDGVAATGAPNSMDGLQLGTDAGYETTGYYWNYASAFELNNPDDSYFYSANDSGFVVGDGGMHNKVFGKAELYRFAKDEHLWFYDFQQYSTNIWRHAVGYKTLSGPLTKVRIKSNSFALEGRWSIRYE